VNYQPHNQQQEIAKAVLQKASHFRENQDGPPFGALITGPPRSGKTHLAVSMLKEICRLGFSGIFVSYPRLLEQLRQDHLKDPMNSPDIKLLLDRDVVLIDDVAPMRNFPIIIMEAIPLVIRHRYNQMKSVS
jgi:DNA replication protein DnaC